VSAGLLVGVAAAFAAVDPRDVRRAGDHAVWYLNEPGLFARSGHVRREAIDLSKRRVLQLFADSASAFLVHPEEPPKSWARGPWTAGRPQTLRVPRPVELDEPVTQHWLFSLGNWFAYIAATPIEFASGTPDPFRTDAAELLAWMSQIGMTALISSFPDDDAWVVAVAEDLTEQTKDIKNLVGAEMAKIAGIDLRKEIAQYLIEPVREMRTWDYSTSGERLPVWIVAKFPGHDVELAYSEFGHGVRGDRWGIVLRSDDRFGRDDAWFLRLEDAFISSGRYSSPIPDDYGIP
jgi:hypothetical protein